MPQPFLSIVIPAYNEQARLGPTLTAVLAWAKKSSRQVEPEKRHALHRP